MTKRSVDNKEKQLKVPPNGNITLEVWITPLKQRVRTAEEVINN